MLMLICLLLLMLCIVFIEVSDNQINFWTRKKKKKRKTVIRLPVDNLIYFQNCNAGCSTTSLFLFFLFLFVCLFFVLFCFLFVCFFNHARVRGKGIVQWQSHTSGHQ